MTLAGAIYVDDQPVTLEQLESRLTRVGEQSPDTLIIIKADTGVGHGRVVAVMDLARSLGLSKLAIATEPNEESN